MDPKPSRRPWLALCVEARPEEPTSAQLQESSQEHHHLVGRSQQDPPLQQ